jgi:FecR protein
MSDEYLWDPAASPDPEIERLEAVLRPAAYRPGPLREQDWPSRTRHFRAIRLAALAAGALLVAGGLFALRRGTVEPWSVVAERGMPVVRDASGNAAGRTLARGGVVETDTRSSAMIAVGRIGRAALDPGSRLRLLGADASEHRLSLERGTMHASVNAPPRYFLVQTASALAVDLGCAYTLTVDERGNGALTVEEGEVELQLGEVRTAVLAGNTASLRSGRGPGLPHPVRASDSLRRAVAAYEADPSSGAALTDVLAAADARSTITLWHLLQRAEPAQRERVFERLASIAPPPASVTRERIVRGESGALQRWRTELQPAWAVEPPVWRRVWLALNR